VLYAVWVPIPIPIVHMQLGAAQFLSGQSSVEYGKHQNPPSAAFAKTGAYAR
jgi:hypothetical protein